MGEEQTEVRIRVMSDLAPREVGKEICRHQKSWLCFRVVILKKLKRSTVVIPTEDALHPTNPDNCDMPSAKKGTHVPFPQRLVMNRETPVWFADTHKWNCTPSAPEASHWGMLSRNQIPTSAILKWVSCITILPTYEQYATPRRHHVTRRWY